MPKRKDGRKQFPPNNRARLCRPPTGRSALTGEKGAKKGKSAVHHALSFLAAPTGRGRHSRAPTCHELSFNCGKDIISYGQDGKFSYWKMVRIPRLTPIALLTGL